MPEWRKVGSVNVAATAKMAAAAPIQVALTSELGRAEPLEGQDEADDGDQVGQVAQVAHGEGGGEHHEAPPGELRPESVALADCPLALSPGLALNISSMRSVTTKPPTMLRVARSTARKPNVHLGRPRAPRP